MDLGPEKTNKMEKNEKNDIDFNEVVGEELTMDDLASKFIKNPKVGESVVLPVAKIVKNHNVKFKTKDGVQINKSLSSVDFNYEIHTTDERVYTCNSWEVFGKIKEICRELKKTKDFTVKITHIKDGKLGKKGANNYTVELISNKAS